MIRLVRVELLKVRTTRLWIGLLIPSLGLAALGAILRFALVGTPEGRQAGLTEVRTLQDMKDVVLSGGVVAIFAIVLGATSATSEFRYQTMSGTVLATPRRWTVVTAKAISSAVIGGALGLVGALLPLGIGVVWLTVRGDPVPFGAPVAWAIAGVAAEAAYSAILGAGIGAAVRSQLVAILSLLGWLIVVEPLAGAFVPSLIRWMPFAGADGLFGRSSATPGEVFGPAVAAVLLAGYVASTLAAGIWLTERRDVP